MLLIPEQEAKAEVGEFEVNLIYIVPGQLGSIVSLYLKNKYTESSSPATEKQVGCPFCNSGNYQF